MIPENITTHFKRSWVKHIRKIHNKPFEDDFIKDSDITEFIYGINHNISGCIELGKALSKRDKQNAYFWEKVICGNYILYYEHFPSYKEIKIEGQIFMI